LKRIEQLLKGKGHFSGEDGKLGDRRCRKKFPFIRKSLCQKGSFVVISGRGGEGFKPLGEGSGQGCRGERKKYIWQVREFGAKGKLRRGRCRDGHDWSGQGKGKKWKLF